MSEKDGGSAFPSSSPYNPSDMRINFDGLSVRDYFAAKVFAGLLANPNVVVANPNCGWDLCNTSLSNLAAQAYDFADAMLKERAKTGLLALALDAIVADTHTLRIESVPDGRETNYAVICSCGFETGEFTSQRCAESRLRYPCEVEAVLGASERRRTHREQRQTAA